jgi:diguanylate cyclase (GGDEF)-like protein
MKFSLKINKLISRITFGIRFEQSEDQGIFVMMEKTFAALFRKEVMQEDKASAKRNCQFFQDSGVPDDGGTIGCCKLNEETICFGDLQFCKNPEALSKHFSQKGLGWRERRKPERPRLVGEASGRGLSASSVSYSIIEHIRDLPQTFLVAVALLITIFVGVLNRLMGPELSSSILYLIPISMVTWFTKRWLGILLSVLSALNWLITDAASGIVFSSSTVPYWNGLARFGSFLIFTFILAELKRALENEKNSSRIDFLTEVRNRRYFIELVDMEVKRAHTDDQPFSILYIDLDNFKLINDAFGHSAGDNLLRLVAKTIQDNIRKTDVVARLGGDEFAILLPGTGPELAEVITRRIQKINLDMVKKHEWPVTFSMGTVTFVGPPSTVNEVLKIADDLMYGAKKEGKNTFKHEVFGKKGWVPVRVT